MAEERKCPECGNPLKIEATHNYPIYRSAEGHWCKGIGNAIYQCGSCEVNLSTSEIEDILRQVDEL